MVHLYGICVSKAIGVDDMVTSEKEVIRSAIRRPLKLSVAPKIVSNLLVNRSIVPCPESLIMANKLVFDCANARGALAIHLIHAIEEAGAGLMKIRSEFVN
jgi:hypothetical protein